MQIIYCVENIRAVTNMNNCRTTKVINKQITYNTQKHFGEILLPGQAIENQLNAAYL